VGCEKCRLWGKLQFMGLGVAMKVLFADAPHPAGAPSAPSAGGAGDATPLSLTRNEVVALVNLLHRVAMSVAAVGVLRDVEAATKLQRWAVSVGVPSPLARWLIGVDERRWGVGSGLVARLALAAGATVVALVVAAALLCRRRGRDPVHSSVGGRHGLDAAGRATQR
jgi:hypothetical protein